MVKIILAFGLLLFFLIIASFSSKRKSKNRPVDLSNYLNKISVDLEKCDIISGDNRQRNDPYINVMNPGGSAYSILSNSDEVKYSTYITYLHDNFRFVAGPLDVSELGAKAACLKKQTTYIYYNKTDYSDYYFDVNFILS